MCELLRSMTIPPLTCQSAVTIKDHKTSDWQTVKTKSLLTQKTRSSQNCPHVENREFLLLLCSGSEHPGRPPAWAHSSTPVPQRLRQTRREQQASRSEPHTNIRYWLWFFPPSILGGNSSWMRRKVLAFLLRLIEVWPEERPPASGLSPATAAEGFPHTAHTPRSQMH